MEIQIIQATQSHQVDCKEIMLNSRFGREYFPEEENAHSLLAEGISKGEIFVALDEAGACLGFIFFILKGAFNAYPYLEIIAVREDLRGKGVGSRLLQFFEDAVFPDTRRVFLVVADFNTDAKQLYERIGYRQVGEIPGLYRDWITEHLMMKDREDTALGRI